MCEISVIITMYNEADNIEYTIDQILSQTFYSYEVILIDDCSLDETYQIAKNKISNEPKISLFRNEENKGAAFSRNVGLELAKGKYVIFLDADDIFSNVLLERLYNEIVENNAQVACCRSEIVDVRTKSRRIFGQWKRIGRLVGESESLIIENPCIFEGISLLIDLTAWSKLILKEYLIEQEIKFQNIESFNDLSFALKSCLLANRIVFVNETLIEYLQYNTGSISAKRKKSYCPIVSAYDNVLQNEKIKKKKCYDELINRAIHNILAIAFEVERDQEGKRQILNDLKKTYKKWIYKNDKLDPICYYTLKYLITNDVQNINKKELFEYMIYEISKKEGIVKVFDEQKEMFDILSQYSACHLSEKIKIVSRGNDSGYEFRALCI